MIVPADADMVKSGIEIARMQQVATALRTYFDGVDTPGMDGVAAIEVDRSVRQFLHRRGLHSALTGYRGYPAHCSVSINDVAVHGIPDDRVISRGDVVSLDVAASGGGWFTDMAWSFLMPGASRRAKDEYVRAWRSFSDLIVGITPNMSLHDLAVLAEDTAAHYGLVPIAEFTGHGIGRRLHEAPVVPFRPQALSSAGPGERIRLMPGTVINIEPVYRVISGADSGVIRDENGWSYRTADGSRAYHFELTLVITDRGASILQWGGMPTRDLLQAPPFGVL